MKAGDRVMVYDSPGHPLDHWLYATVISDPAQTGAQVQIDHPGNVSHGLIRFVKNEKMRTSEDALKLAQEAKAASASTTDPTQRTQMQQRFQHYTFIASELS